MKIIKNFKMLYRWYLLLDNAKLERKQRKLQAEIAKKEATLLFRSIQSHIQSEILGEPKPQYVVDEIDRINHKTCETLAIYIDNYILEGITLKEIKHNRQEAIAKALKEITPMSITEEKNDENTV